MACRAGSPPVNDSDLAELQPQTPEWEIIREADIRKLDRVFPFPDFGQALDFTRAVGELADAEGHHPRIVTEWGRVAVTWWTHKIKDIHRNDFIMAVKTDLLFRKFPSAGPG